MTEIERKDDVARNDERKRLEKLHGNDEQKIREGLAVWRKANPEPHAASLTDVADHIDYIRKIAGIDHVGIGSDFDGFSGPPEGLEDVSKYPDLLAELLRRGYSREEIKKIAGLNVLRVMRGVERVAKGLQTGAPTK
ncbi:MAG: membrane dipeptidase [Verrucomicrobiota bacterium]